jgi:hypothetical protein
MKRWMPATGLSIALLASTIGAGSAQAAPASTPLPLKPVCVPVSATGQGQDHGNFHTTAKVFVGPALIATTAAAFTPTGMTGTTVSFAGPIIFTAVGNLGTFTVAASGTVDTSTGHFEAGGQITAPTGLLVGTTGDLMLVGNENLMTLAFTETVTGQLCVRATGHNILVP